MGPARELAVVWDRWDPGAQTHPTLMFHYNYKLATNLWNPLAYTKKRFCKEESSVCPE